MGFFKSMHDLNKQAKGMQRNQPPAGAGWPPCRTGWRTSTR